MASWADVRTIASTLPETSEGDQYGNASLDRVDPAELRELLVEAWLARAPKRLAQAYLSASQ